MRLPSDLSGHEIIPSLVLCACVCVCLCVRVTRAFGRCAVSAGLAASWEQPCNGFAGYGVLGRAMWLHSDAPDPRLLRVGHHVPVTWFGILSVVAGT